MSLERPQWPDSARCVVTLTFDNFGESFDLLRYGHAGGANADGVYAPRRGVERVLDLLERHGIQATFFVEGWNARKYAGLAREVVDRGHEIASHGWMHEQWNELPEEVERDLIARATETLSEVTGTPPRGWRSPSGLTTTATLPLLHEFGYLYDSSMGDDDIPYRVKTGRGEDELLELPWSWPLDDAVYFAHPGAIRRPNDVIDYWTDEFDAALELTGAFMLVCHPRYIGRPARILAFERLIDHMQSQPGVAFSRCDRLAESIQAADWLPRYAAPAQIETE